MLWYSWGDNDERKKKYVLKIKELSALWPPKYFDKFRMQQIWTLNPWTFRSHFSTFSLTNVSPWYLRFWMPFKCNVAVVEGGLLERGRKARRWRERRRRRRRRREGEEEDIFRVKAIVQLGYHYFLVLRSCPSTRCSRRSVAKHIFRLHAI